MAKKVESINTTIFSALKVSELSKVPVLIISNPGIGKSTTVEMFSKIRGYELILLRGNSTTNEEVMGYDTVPSGLVKGSKAGAVHLRPSWFDKMMDFHEEGKKTLLFLDEITTANEFVQASLLHLIFERMCGDEKLPDDTLIVAAGNYAQNLSNTMSMLPPTMNRFMIFNITPTDGDLETFLCKYKGASTSVTGTCSDFMSELANTLTMIDSQEITLDESRKCRIADYIESCIVNTTRRLWKEGTLDMSVTELNDIYSSTEKDALLYGFITFRTLNYLRDVTLAFFQAFGKDGILSKNYLNAINGLTGLAITRNSSNGEVKTTIVSREYFNDMKQTVSEILKMENEKLPEYQKFFLDIVNDSKTASLKSKFEIPEVLAIGNKIEELKLDKEIAKIERPIDSVLINQILESLVQTSKDECGAKYKIVAGTPVEVDELTKWVVSWNAIAKTVVSIISLTTDTSRNYKEDVASKVKSCVVEYNKALNRLRAIKRSLIDENPSVADLVPEINSIK